MAIDQSAISESSSRDEIIRYLATKTLPKLRERQDILKLQIIEAYKQGKTKTLSKLQDWYNQTSDAISLREFGEYQSILKVRCRNEQKTSTPDDSGV